MSRTLGKILLGSKQGTEADTVNNMSNCFHAERRKHEVDFSKRDSLMSRNEYREAARKSGLPSFGDPLLRKTRFTRQSHARERPTQGMTINIRRLAIVRFARHVGFTLTETKLLLADSICGPIPAMGMHWLGVKLTQLDELNR